MKRQFEPSRPRGLHVESSGTPKREAPEETGSSGPFLLDVQPGEL